MLCSTAFGTVSVGWQVPQSTKITQWAGTRGAVCAAKAGLELGGHHVSLGPSPSRVLPRGRLRRAGQHGLVTWVPMAHTLPTWHQEGAWPRKRGHRARGLSLGRCLHQLETSPRVPTPGLLLAAGGPRLCLELRAAPRLGVPLPPQLWRGHLTGTCVCPGCLPQASSQPKGDTCQEMWSSPHPTPTARPPSVGQGGGEGGGWPVGAATSLPPPLSPSPWTGAALIDFQGVGNMKCMVLNLRPLDESLAPSPSAGQMAARPPRHTPGLCGPFNAVNGAKVWESRWAPGSHVRGEWPCSLGGLPRRAVGWGGGEGQGRSWLAGFAQKLPECGGGPDPPRWLPGSW